MTLADRIFQPLADAATWLLFRNLDRKLCAFSNLTDDPCPDLGDADDERAP